MTPTTKAAIKMPLEHADIQALAQALQQLNTGNAAAPTVNATSVKLPQFWQGNPEVWFAQVESVFNTRKITTQKTKFDYVIQALDNFTADRVQGIVLSPPDTTPYDAIKKALVKAFGKSQEQKDQELLNLNGLGDRKPSDLLQHMQNLNADPKTLFKALFVSQMPPDVRKILSTSAKTDIAELASEADKIVEASSLAASSEVNKVAMPRRPAPSPTSGKCWIHAKFGEEARKCTGKDGYGNPCLMQKRQSGNENAGR